MKRYNILILLLSILIVLFPFGTDLKSNTIKKGILKVHFIDVGQGDSTLITIDDKSLLIDSGGHAASEKVLSYLKKEGIKKITHVVATHPHEDHIGSMELIIDNFKIENFWAPKVTSNASYYNRMIKSLKRKNLKINVAKEGKIINLHPKVKCEILSPIKDNYDNLNNYSAVIKLSYNKFNFLFMGDAEGPVEGELTERNDLRCDILKLGHHGSNTSSSEKFLESALPQLAIASCGKNNTFGHPNKKVINRLENKNIKLYRTDIHGDIVFGCDGKSLMKTN